MKRIFLLLTGSLLYGAAVCQSTTYSLASFTIPAGYQKTENESVWVLHSPENDKGIFCIISIYQATAGSNRLSTDFANAWKELAADRLQVKDQPQVDPGEGQNGWISQTGTATFSIQGATALAVLTTMSGHGKMMNFLVITNDASFQTDLEKFYGSINMSKPAVQKNNSSSPANMPLAVSDYTFTVPPGWTKEVLANEIVLHGSDKNSTISLLPMQSSSGDLDKDMSSIFWQVFDGWKDDYWNPDHKISTKGILPGGWPYYKEERGIEKDLGNNKKAQAYGLVMLVQVNEQVAIVAGSYVNGSDLLNESMHTDWIQFFHSLTFKNAANVNEHALNKEILGEWLTGSASGLATYSFYPNGHYSDGSAFSTSREYSTYKTLETTTSIAGDGTYQLNGNNLLLTRTDNKKTSQYQVRVFTQKQYGAWVKKIGLLTTSLLDGTLYELTMVLQEKK